MVHREAGGSGRLPSVRGHELLRQLAGTLRQTPLYQDLLTNVPESVGDGSGGDLTPEHVTHVFAGLFVPTDIGEVLAVIPAHPPHADGVDWLTVQTGSRVRINQLERSLVQLQHKVSSLTPNSWFLRLLLVLGAEIHDTPVDGLGAVLRREVLLPQLAPAQADHHDLHSLEPSTSSIASGVTAIVWNISANLVFN